jgi:hypothetical protein
MDLMSFVMQLERDNVFHLLVNAPDLQFGTNEQPYLGASFLPEQTVNANFYEESAIRLMTTIANDGARYAPVQQKDVGEMWARWDVKLADSDIGANFTSRDYDGLLEMLKALNDGVTPASNPQMAAAANVLMNWVDVRITRALTDLNEKQRWDAIVGAQVIRRGDNAYTETINYINPAGHRVAAGGTWSDDAYDPWPDIVAAADLLTSKGYTVNRIVCPLAVRRILEGNTKIANRFASRTAVVISGLPTDMNLNRMNVDALSAGFQRNELPSPETYDRRYRDGTGLHTFLPSGTMVFFATTGRDVTVPILTGDRFLPDTSGYFAIGRAAGQASPGRVVRVTPYGNKPPRLEAEGWQTTLPVITEPESMVVITGIS